MPVAARASSMPGGDARDHLGVGQADGGGVVGRGGQLDVDRALARAVAQVGRGDVAVVLRRADDGWPRGRRCRGSRGSRATRSGRRRSCRAGPRRRGGRRGGARAPGVAVPSRWTWSSASGRVIVHGARSAAAIAAAASPPTVNAARNRAAARSAAASSRAWTAASGRPPGPTSSPSPATSVSPTAWSTPSSSRRRPPPSSSTATPDLADGDRRHRPGLGGVHLHHAAARTAGGGRGRRRGRAGRPAPPPCGRTAPPRRPRRAPRRRSRGPRRRPPPARRARSSAAASASVTSTRRGSAVRGWVSASIASPHLDRVARRAAEHLVHVRQQRLAGHARPARDGRRCARASSRAAGPLGQEGARAGLDVHDERVEPGGELLGEDGGGDERDRLDGGRSRRAARRGAGRRARARRSGRRSRSPPRPRRRGGSRATACCRSRGSRRACPASRPCGRARGPRSSAPRRRRPPRSARAGARPCRPRRPWSACRARGRASQASTVPESRMAVVSATRSRVVEVAEEDRHGAARRPGRRTASRPRCRRRGSAISSSAERPAVALAADQLLGDEVSSHRRPSPPAPRRAWRARRRAGRRRRSGTSAGPPRPGRAARRPARGTRPPAPSVRTPPEALKPAAPPRSAIASSIARAASGVAPGWSLPVEVLTKSAPASMAPSAAARMTSGRCRRPVSRIAFSRAGGGAAARAASTTASAPASSPASQASYGEHDVDLVRAVGDGLGASRAGARRVAVARRGSSPPTATRDRRARQLARGDRGPAAVDADRGDVARPACGPGGRGRRCAASSSSPVRLVRSIRGRTRRAQDGGVGHGRSSTKRSSSGPSRAAPCGRDAEGLLVRQLLAAHALGQVGHGGDRRRRRSPACRAAITSGTVDMPTRSAPSVRKARISAGVSKLGPAVAR